MSRVLLSDKSLLDIIAMTPEICISFKENGELRSWKSNALAEPVFELPRKVVRVANGEKTDSVLLRVLRSNPGVEAQLLDSKGQFVVRLNGIRNIVYPKGTYREGEYLISCSAKGNTPVRIAKIQP